MRAAGAPVEPLSADEVRARLPFFGYDWGGGIFDPLAGSLRIRRALDALAARVNVVRAHRDRPRRARGRRGARLRRDRHARAGAATLDFELTYDPHVRVTYEAGRQRPVRHLARALRLRARQHRPLRDRDARPVRARRASSLEPCGRVECVSPHAPWLDAHGDGFLALQQGPRHRVHGQQPDEVRPADRRPAGRVGPGRGGPSGPSPPRVAPRRWRRAGRRRTGSALSFSPRKPTESSATIAG